MLIVLQYHGVPMGPKLFIESPLLAYGIFMSMVVSYIFMIPLMLPLARYMARVTLVPTKYLAPLITIFVIRSEEHTSELQSLMRISYAVFCLKKKNILRNNNKN